MKNYFIFIVAGLLASNIEAKVIKVTSASTDETNKGSFLYCLKHANEDAVRKCYSICQKIRFGIANQCTFSAEKQLVINGKNVNDLEKYKSSLRQTIMQKEVLKFQTEYPGGVMTQQPTLLSETVHLGSPAISWG